MILLVKKIRIIFGYSSGLLRLVPHVRRKKEKKQRRDSNQSWFCYLPKKKESINLVIA